MEFAFLFVLLGGVLIIRIFTSKNHAWKTPNVQFPDKWKPIIIKKVQFYNALTEEEKRNFEYRIQEFLLNCRITGVKTGVNDEDKLLIAASAIIPIFQFKDWKYTNIQEVLVYPKSFNKDFQTEGDERNILGMVGTGYMDGKMILSKEALYHGFENETDKKNTAVHEFIHLVDKMDGSIDGIPSLLLEKQYVLPWLEMMDEKIKEICSKTADINPYGATNRQEFFAVTGEYFFERPKLLEKKHPELYAMLEEIFNHDMSDRALNGKKQHIGRNSPCPCNSGSKFKKCCGQSHY